MKAVLNPRTWMLAGVLGAGLLALASASWAVPAQGGLADVVQPDGTAIQLRLFGDEFYSWHETANGYTVVRGADGFWRYAVRDATGDLAAGNQRVGIDARLVSLAAKLQPDPALVREKRRRGRQAFGVENEVLPAPAEAQAVGEPITPPPPARIEPRGTVKNLVILVKFSDHDATKYRPAAEYDPLFNEVGYTTGSAAGSVRDYFYEASYGNLTMQTTIAGNKWYSLSNTEAYYDANSIQMVRDAVSLANADVDFTQFDTDGDGWIDAIDIIHSGYGQEYGGAPATYIWSHQGWVGDPSAVADGINVSCYHTEPALRNLTGTNIVRIGVICHETCHFFGLPDLYDTDGAGNGGQSNGVGGWCLMASGSWGADGGSYPQRPVHLCSWSKWQLGWLDPTPIHTNTGWSLPRYETNPSAYIIREGLPATEYFLAANLTAYGFDTNLLNSGGLEILHVDESTPTNQNPYRMRVQFEEADGNWSLRSGTSRAQAGDPWPGSASNTSFNDSTTPNTRSNPSNAGSTSYNSFASISSGGSPRTFDLTSLVPWVTSPASSGGSYNVTWSASASATAYELQEGTTSTATSYTDDCSSGPRFYEDWATQGTVRRIVAPSTSDYTYLMQFYDTGATTWYDQYYVLRFKKSVRVTATSNSFSYQVKYGLNSNSQRANVGYFQIRRDSDTAWTTLDIITGANTASWSTRTVTGAALAPFVGSNCYVRFVVANNLGNVWTYGGWPYDGLAITSFTISGGETESTTWTSLDTNATSPYGRTKSSSGGWVYRVRANANAAWQAWSNVSATAVTISAPSVSSIVRAGASPTNAASVDFTVTFSESVTGVDAADFALTASGVSGASVGSVSGSGTTRTVSVNTGSGNGTIRLDVTDDDSIVNGSSIPLGGAGAGNGNFTGGQSYTIDKTAPTVSMASAAPNPTKTSPIPVTVTFSESVTGFAAGDVTVSSATVNNFTGSGASYAFDLVPAGQGSVTADIGAGAGQDSAGNGNTTAAQFQRTFDNVRPTVTLTSIAPDPTSVSPIPVSVAFSEPVTGFVVSALTLSSATTVNFAGAGANYTFDLIPSASGLVRASVAAGVAQDSAANTNLASGIFSRTYAGGTAPAVLAILRLDPNPTSGPLVRFGVLFSTAVTGVDVSDFNAVTTGPTGVSIQSVADGPITYTVTLNVTGGAGPLRLDVVDDDSIRDGSDNRLGGAGAGNGNFAGPVYMVDRVRPATHVTTPIGTIYQADPIIPVAYSATDAGAGMRSVRLYYRRNFTGAFLRYGSEFTTPTIAFDTSATGGDGSYELYTIGVDQAGNVELAPARPDRTLNFNVETGVPNWRRYR
jgi:M6 family metalloprotease-like protein